MQSWRYLRDSCPSLHPFAGRVVFVAVTAILLGCTAQPDRPTGQNSQQVAIQKSQPVKEVPTGSQQVKEAQTGSAAFINEDLQGKKTASGETYEQDQVVAAHPSYPMGTVARVTNLENGRTVVVRIIDRIASPKSAEEPIIDLSRAAAEQLGFIHKGKVRIKSEVIQWGDEHSKQ